MLRTISSLTECYSISQTTSLCVSDVNTAFPAVAVRVCYVFLVLQFSKKGSKDREEALTASASSTVPQDKMQAAMKEEMAKKVFCLLG